MHPATSFSEDNLKPSPSKKKKKIEWKSSADLLLGSCSHVQKKRRKKSLFVKRGLAAECKSDDKKVAIFATGER
jgi:hypothetical protein